jgi:hypothetical protein
MFSRAWSNGLAVGIIFGGATAIFSFVWIIGLNYCPGSPCKYENGPEDGHSKFYHWVPFSIGPDTTSDVEPEDTKGAKGYQERQDLRAQETAARAANAAIYLSIITILLGLVGTYAIFRTLFETRETNAIARDIGEAQIRAYIGHNGIVTRSHWFLTDKKRIFWRFHVSIKNIVQTPAKSVRIRRKMLILVASDPTPSLEKNETTIETSLGPNDAITIGSIDVLSEELVAVQDGHLAIYVIYEVSYKNAINAKSNHITRVGLKSGVITGDPSMYWEDIANPMNVQFDHVRGMNCLDEECRQK